MNMVDLLALRWLLTFGILLVQISSSWGQNVPGLAKENPKDGQEYVWVPPGSSLMGCVPQDQNCDDDEKPRHHVTISKGFWIGRSEVTASAYQRFAQSVGRAMPVAPHFNVDWAEGDHPMVLVTWHEARDYCDWAGGRLPKEAEWEFAARGGKPGLLYPSGNTPSPEHGNCLGKMGDDQWDYTCPVRNFRPNAYGLYGMAGNVWEWVSDWYGKDYYATSPSKDPRGPFSGESTVVRGGSWSDAPESLRVSERSAGGSTVRRYNVGFRCVLPNSL